MTEATTLGLTLPYSYGRGWPVAVPLVDPAPGQPADLRVPGDADRRILVAQATLTTSAAVANRVPLVVFLDPDKREWARFGPDVAVAASQAIVVTWAVGIGMTTGAAGAQMTAPIPDLLLPPGHTVRVTADGIDAADQLSNVRIYAENYPIGRGGYDTGRADQALPAIPQ